MQIASFFKLTKTPKTLVIYDEEWFTLEMVKEFFPDAQRMYPFQLFPHLFKNTNWICLSKYLVRRVGGQYYCACLCGDTSLQLIYPSPWDPNDFQLTMEHLLKYSPPKLKRQLEADLNSSPSSEHIGVVNSALEQNRAHCEALLRQFQARSKMLNRIVSIDSRTVVPRIPISRKYLAISQRLLTQKAVDGTFQRFLIRESDQFDQAVIVAGDADHLPAIMDFQEGGRKVYVVNFINSKGESHRSLSDHLIRYSDGVIDFHREDLLKFLRLNPRRLSCSI